MTPHPFVTAFKPRPHTVAAEDPSGIEAAQGLDMALWTGKMFRGRGLHRHRVYMRYNIYAKSPHILGVERSRPNRDNCYTATS